MNRLLHKSTTSVLRKHKKYHSSSFKLRNNEVVVTTVRQQLKQQHHHQQQQRQCQTLVLTNKSLYGNSSIIPMHNPRSFATAAAASTSTSTKANAKGKGKETPKAQTVGDVFLDNLGKVFLSTIALIVGALVRSSMATTNKNNVRVSIEESTPLDPFEIDDLHLANYDLDKNIFEQIMIGVEREFGSIGGSGSISGGSSGGIGHDISHDMNNTDTGRSSMSKKVDYRDFVSVVMNIMKNIKGEGFTIQLGYLLDRVVISLLEAQAEAKAQMQTQSKSDGSNNQMMTMGQGFNNNLNDNDIGNDIGNDDDGKIELSLLLVALSLCMRGSIHDRVEVLFEIMRRKEKEQNQHQQQSQQDQHQEQEQQFQEQYQPQQLQIQEQYQDKLGNKEQDNDHNQNQQQDQEQDQQQDQDHPVVNKNLVVDMVGYLQKTCQLAPDAQIVASDTKYPVQKYRIGTPSELSALGIIMKKDELKEDALREDVDGEGKGKGEDNNKNDELGQGLGNKRSSSTWTCEDFHHLLRSRAICAWGECYVKKKGLN